MCVSIANFLNIFSSNLPAWSDPTEYPTTSARKKNTGKYSENGNSEIAIPPQIVHPKRNKRRYLCSLSSSTPAYESEIKQYTLFNYWVSYSNIPCIN